MLEIFCLFLTCDIGSVEVYFCPPNNCEEIMLQYLNKNFYCTFYDLELPKINKVLDERKVLVDEDNYFGYGTKIISPGLMHNKFCASNNITITGSFNPTPNGKQNKNILAIISGEKLAKNYLEEWQEIRNYEQKATDHKIIYYPEFTIKNYFCPEDNCEAEVIKELQKAKAEIYFEQFSFTSKKIAETLVKQKIKGVKISGVFDRIAANTRYSQMQYLNNSGINVSIWNGSAKLHNKIFIIDNVTWIFGSYNPTSSGNNKNDENILVLSS